MQELGHFTLPEAAVGSDGAQTGSGVGTGDEEGWGGGGGGERRESRGEGGGIGRDGASGSSQEATCPMQNHNSDGAWPFAMMPMLVHVAHVRVLDLQGSMFCRCVPQRCAVIGDLKMCISGDLDIPYAEVRLVSAGRELGDGECIVGDMSVLLTIPIEVEVLVHTAAGLKGPFILMIDANATPLLVASQVEDILAIAWKKQQLALGDLILHWYRTLRSQGVRHRSHIDVFVVNKLSVRVIRTATAECFHRLSQDDIVLDIKTRGTETLHTAFCRWLQSRGQRPAVLDDFVVFDLGDIRHSRRRRLLVSRIASTNTAARYRRIAMVPRTEDALGRLM